MSLLAALTPIVFWITTNIRDATSRERFTTILAIYLCPHGLPGSCELYLHTQKKRKLLVMKLIKRLQTVEREVKDVGFLGRTFQTSLLQNHLSIRKSKLVLSLSIAGFLLCFWSCTHNNAEKTTELSNVSFLCCLLLDSASCSVRKMEGNMELERLSSSSLLRQMFFNSKQLKKWPWISTRNLQRPMGFETWNFISDYNNAPLVLIWARPVDGKIFAFFFPIFLFSAFVFLTDQ